MKEGHDPIGGGGEVGAEEKTVDTKKLQNELALFAPFQTVFEQQSLNSAKQSSLHKSTKTDMIVCRAPSSTT